MSMATGRVAIETYLGANWTATVIGYDGQPFAPVADSLRLTIMDGATRQGSIGRVTNSVYSVGTVTLSLFTDGTKGSIAWRAYADTLLGLFHNITLDAAGAVIASQSQTPLVRFSPPEMGQDSHPYIGANIKDPPFNMVNIIAPFVRYELR